MSVASVITVLIALAQAAEPPVQAATPAAPAEPPAPAESAEADPAPPTPLAPIPYEPPGVRPFEPTEATPSEPVPYLPGANDRIPAAPVTLEAYRRSYEAPPDARELAYEAGVRRNADAQQARFGPLDGSWTVRTQAGVPLMMLVLVDRGQPGGEIEGAWRQHGTRPGLGRSGLLLSVGRESEALVLRWYPNENTGNISSMRLIRGPDGVWTGAVQSGDREFPVTMSR